MCVLHKSVVIEPFETQNRNSQSESDKCAEELCATCTRVLDDDVVHPRLDSLNLRSTIVKIEDLVWCGFQKRLHEVELLDELHAKEHSDSTDNDEKNEKGNAERVHVFISFEWVGKQ